MSQDIIEFQREIREKHPDILTLLKSFQVAHPELEPLIAPIWRVFREIVHCYSQKGTLFTCGNGGSYADSLHIAGELMKSFERKRPLPVEDQAKLTGLPFGEQLAQHLEIGLAAIPLGMNGSLITALENDIPLRSLQFAQELYALGKPGDVLIGISTSGNAQNVLMAMSVANIKEITCITLTGEHGGKMAHLADIAVKAPASRTFLVQEYHLALYHLICALVEAYWFKNCK